MFRVDVKPERSPEVTSEAMRAATKTDTRKQTFWSLFQYT